jgi:hypothetical protein
VPGTAIDSGGRVLHRPAWNPATPSAAASNPNATAHRHNMRGGVSIGGG